MALVGVIHRAHRVGAGLGHLETFWHPFQRISAYAEPKLGARWVGRVPGVSSGCV